MILIKFSDVQFLRWVRTHLCNVTTQQARPLKSESLVVSCSLTPFLIHSPSHCTTNWFYPPTFFSLPRATPDFFPAWHIQFHKGNGHPFFPLTSRLKLQSRTICSLIVLMITYQTGSLLYPLHVEKVTWTFQGGRCGFEPSLCHSPEN